MLATFTCRRRGDFNGKDAMNTATWQHVVVEDGVSSSSAPLLSIHLAIHFLPKSGQTKPDFFATRSLACKSEFRASGDASSAPHAMRG